MLLGRLIWVTLKRTNREGKLAASLKAGLARSLISRRMLHGHQILRLDQNREFVRPTTKRHNASAALRFYK